MPVLAQVLRQLETIQADGLVSVCINFHSVGPRDVEALAQALTGSKTLRYLDLSTADVGAFTAVTYSCIICD